MTTTRNRCHFVGIHTPQDDAAKRVTFCREADLVVPFLPDLAVSVRTVTDPVTGQSVTFSGAALALWMTAEYDARNLADITPAQEPTL